MAGGGDRQRDAFRHELEAGQDRGREAAAEVLLEHRAVDAFEHPRGAFAFARVGDASCDAGTRSGRRPRRPCRRRRRRPASSRRGRRRRRRSRRRLRCPRPSGGSSSRARGPGPRGSAAGIRLRRSVCATRARSAYSRALSNASAARPVRSSSTRSCPRCGAPACTKDITPSSRPRATIGTTVAEREYSSLAGSTLAVVIASPEAAAVLPATSATTGARCARAAPGRPAARRAVAGAPRGASVRRARPTCGVDAGRDRRRDRAVLVDEVDHAQLGELGQRHARRSAAASAAGPARCRASPWPRSAARAGGARRASVRARRARPPS